jgi:hypothetical protein
MECLLRPFENLRLIAYVLKTNWKQSMSNTWIEPSYQIQTLNKCLYSYALRVDMEYEVNASTLRLGGRE